MTFTIIFLLSLNITSKCLNYLMLIVYSTAIIYRLPVYELDEDKHPERCSKSYPTHNKFSPGLLIIACEHRICYGFQILRRHESTVVIFNMLLSLFRNQPRVIIYENACNLHKTCMMR